MFSVRQKIGFNPSTTGVSYIISLYPFRPVKVAIFSWRAIASQQFLLFGFAGHMDFWLAIARQEKIDTLNGSECVIRT